MKSKRIAMISFHTCPLASEEGKETGGMNVYVYELSKQLVKQGYQVDMYTRSQHPTNQEIVQISPQLRLIHLKAGPNDTVPKKQLLQYIPSYIEAYLSFTKKHGLEYDVMHCHYYMSGIIGMQIKERSEKKFPIVMTFHTLALMKNLVARTESEKEEFDRIQAESMLTAQVDKIITPSKSDSEYLEYLYGTKKNKVAIISPGVDTSLFKPLNQREAKKQVGADANDKIILFVGRIEPLKGLDMLLYAMKVLVQQKASDNVSLWIVGGDVTQKPELWSEQLKILNQLLTVLHISMVVNFVGQQPQHMLPYYYNAAEMVAMPSHYESFGIVALEAMACGTPVITTNVAGISSIIDKRHKSLITTVNNPLHLASQIKYLLKNSEAREQIGKEISKQAKEFDWNTIVKKIIGVYEEVSEKYE